MHPLDLVFVHEGRRAPLIGEFIKANETEMRLHVIWGPKEKIGNTVVVDKDNLQDYKVPSFQMQSMFAKTGTPEELKQKGEMYIVTDRPTMYPNITGANIDFNGSSKDDTDAGAIRSAKASLGIGAQHATQDEDPDMAAARASFGLGGDQPRFRSEDPNLSLARDFLKQGAPSSPSFGGGRDRRGDREAPTFAGLGRRLSARRPGVGGGTLGV
jgi:hypothetical protein